MSDHEDIARLHAAAPDMLAALKATTALAEENLKLYYTGRTDDCHAVFRQCMAAIAKAEGNDHAAEVQMKHDARLKNYIDTAVTKAKG